MSIEPPARECQCQWGTLPRIHVGEPFRFARGFEECKAGRFATLRFDTAPVTRERVPTDTGTQRPPTPGTARSCPRSRLNLCKSSCVTASSVEKTFTPVVAMDSKLCTRLFRLFSRYWR
jgi:hypothetical protein